MITISEEKATVLSDLAQNEVVFDSNVLLSEMSDQDKTYHDYNSEFTAKSSDTLHNINAVLENYETKDLSISTDLIKLLSSINNGIMKLRTSTPEIASSSEQINDLLGNLLDLTSGISKNTNLEILKKTKSEIIEIPKILEKTKEILEKDKESEISKKTLKKITELNTKIDSMDKTVEEKLLNTENLVTEIKKINVESGTEEAKLKTQVEELVKENKLTENAEFLKVAKQGIFGMSAADLAIEDFIDRENESGEDENILRSKMMDLMSEYADQRSEVFSAAENSENLTRTTEKLNSIRKLAEQNAGLFSKSDVDEFNSKYDQIIAMLADVKANTKQSRSTKIAETISSGLSGIGSFLDIPVISMLGTGIEKLSTKLSEPADDTDTDLAKEIFDKLAESKQEKIPLRGNQDITEIAKKPNNLIDFPGLPIDLDAIKEQSEKEKIPLRQNQDLDDIFGELVNIGSGIRLLNNYNQVNEKEDDREFDKNKAESDQTQDILDLGFFGINNSLTDMADSVIDLSEKEKIPLRGNQENTGIKSMLGGFLGAASTAVLAFMGSSAFLGAVAAIILGVGTVALLEQIRKFKVSGEGVKTKAQLAIDKIAESGVLSKDEIAQAELDAVNKINQKNMNTFTGLADTKTKEELANNQDYLESLHDILSTRKEQKELEMAKNAPMVPGDWNNGTWESDVLLNPTRSFNMEEFMKVLEQSATEPAMEFMNTAEDIGINTKLSMNTKEPVFIPIPTPSKNIPNANAPQTGSSGNIISTDSDELLLKLFETGIL